MPLMVLKKLFKDGIYLYIRSVDCLNLALNNVIPTTAVVITVGNIPFIGLIVPNIVSIYKGDNIRENIWDTALFGALFVLVCDIFGRSVIYPYELPIGLTVGVIGSAVFLYLILRSQRI